MKLILLIFIFAINLAFVHNLQAQTKAKSEEKNKALSRSDLEFMFGEAVSCNTPSKVCINQLGKEVK